MPLYEFLLFKNTSENFMFIQSLGLKTKPSDYSAYHQYAAIDSHTNKYFSQDRLHLNDQLIKRKDTETIIYSIVLNPQGLNQLLEALGYKPC